MFSKLLSAVMLCFAVTGISTAAQESSDSVWNGEWIAEGTLFRIGVSVEDGVMTVVQIESLGQIWSSQEGTVEGNIANVEVQYLGATGVIQAELIDENTAILHAASCAPDFMVVCTLSRDRQAIFKKVAD